MEDIIKKAKEFDELCKKHHVRYFLSLENQPPSWNTTEDNINNRFRNIIDQLSIDIRDITNNCVDIAYKNSDEKWVINHQI